MTGPWRPTAVRTPRRPTSHGDCRERTPEPSPSARRVELTFRNVPDYEDPADSDDDNVYEVTVEAADEDGETGRLEVQVTVTNVTD